jgi:hypothetical protein
MAEIETIDFSLGNFAVYCCAPNFHGFDHGLGEGHDPEREADAEQTNRS